VPVLACIGIGGYVWRSESTKQRELEQLRSRRVETVPSANPTDDVRANGATNDDRETNDAPIEKRLTAEEILDLAEARWEEIRDFHFTSVVFCRAGEETEHKILDVIFKKPALYRNTVIEGDNEGAVVTYNAEGVIHGRRGGILSVIVLTLKPDDERIRSLRGRRFYEIAWGIELGEMRDYIAAGWTLQRLDDAEMDGLLCYVVAAEGTSEETTLTRSEIWVEQATHLVRRRLDYEGDVLVRDDQYTQIEINTDPDESLFSLK